MTKTKYRLKGRGPGLRAGSQGPGKLLHQLHAGSRFDYEGTDTEYMQRFAHRLEELEGYLVRTDNPTHFLADLIERGFAWVE